MKAFRAFTGLVISIVLIAAGVVLAYRFFGLNIGHGSFTGSLMKGEWTWGNWINAAGLFACLLLISIGTMGSGAWRNVLRTCLEYRKNPYEEYKCTEFPGKNLNQMYTEFRCNLIEGDNLAAVGIARIMCEYMVRAFEDHSGVTVSDETIMAERMKSVGRQYRLGGKVIAAMLEIWDISSECLHGRVPADYELNSIYDDLQIVTEVFRNGPGQSIESERYSRQQRGIILRSRREFRVWIGLWVIVPGIFYLLFVGLGCILYQMTVTARGGW